VSHGDVPVDELTAALIHDSWALDETDDLRIVIRGATRGNGKLITIDSVELAEKFIEELRVATSRLEFAQHWPGCMRTLVWRSNGTRHDCTCMGRPSNTLKEECASDA
jgi:hypothetical protein